MEITIQVGPDDPLFDAIVERAAKIAATKCAKRTKPYTSREFAKARGVSYSTVRARVKANLIATTEDGLIPASEYYRLAEATK